jgi:hypothetical protein
LSGEKVDSVAKSSEVKPEFLVCAMVVLFVFGLIAIAMLIKVMKVTLDLNPGLVVAFTLLSFLIMLLIEGVCIRLLLQGRRGPEEAGEAVPLKGQITTELDAAQARVLPEPMPSVTEHTTRAFEPIPRQRTTK